METSRFKKRKKPNKTKLILMLIVLLGVLYFWMHSEEIIAVFVN